jgi:hypothetical protein
MSVLSGPPRLTGCVLAACGSLLCGPQAFAQVDAAAPATPGATAARAPERRPPRSERTDATVPGESWLVPSAHAAGLMVTMRVGAAVLWPDPFADLSARRMGRSYRDAYTRWPRWDSSRPAFEWDGDAWTINVVGHALFGSELYLRPRVCSRRWWEALAFAAVGSALWEYGFEANAVRPSGLDLWYTPLSGLVLGEARYQGFVFASGLSDPGWRAVLRALFDPLGEFERALGTRC